MYCHNPYFSRWFSAIAITEIEKEQRKVTILILVDGFLQLNMIGLLLKVDLYVTILILVDGFLQYLQIKGLKFIKNASQSLF